MGSWYPGIDLWNVNKEEKKLKRGGVGVEYC